jgi:putative protease
MPKPAPVKVPDHSPAPGEEPVGVVTHYYSHLSVAVVQLDTGSLQIGDTVRFLGHTTDFRQRVDSLEIEHEPVTEAGRRQAFGMKVKEHVREHDVVYKVAR